MLSVSIYTLGDIKVFEATLIAVREMFVSGIIDSGALVGLLITLIWTLAGGVLSPMGKGSFNPAILVVLLALYLGFFSNLMSPKATINIVDLYKPVPVGGPPTASASVTGIPVGLAIPAAVISGVTYDITMKVEEIFMGQTPGVPMTTQGFINPLRLLQTLKNPITNVDPYLEASLRAFATDCVRGEGSPFRQDVFAWSRDAMAYMLANYRDGFTVYYKKPAASASLIQIEESRTGVSTTCSAAADSIETAIHDFLGSSSGLGAFLNVYMPTSTGQTNAVTGRPLQWQEDDIVAAAGSMLNGVAQTSSEFMTNMLFANVANDAFNCAGTMTDYQAANTCNVVLTQASEQWKVDAAAAGSFFQKTMVPTMNMLLLLFYGLSPLIIIYVMMAGWNGLSILTKFLLFGVWTQTWMPFAVIVNSFMQLLTRSELEKVLTLTNPMGGEVSGVTVATRMQLVETLGTKIAAASEILAATPLITLALLTGSVYGLTAMAQRFSGRDYVDEKQAAPSTMTSAPMMQMAARFTGGMGMAHADQSLTNGWSGTVGQAASMAQSSARTELDSASTNLSHTFGRILTQNNTKQVSWKEAQQKMDQLGVGDSHDFKALTNRVMEVGKDFSLTEEQAKNIAMSLGFNIPMTNIGIDGKTNDTDKLTRTYKEALKDNTTSGLTRAVQRTFQQSLSDSKGKESAFTRGLSEQDQQSFQEALSRVRTAQDNYQSSEQMANNFNGSQTLDAQMIANQMAKEQTDLRANIINDGLRVRNAMGDEKWAGYMSKAEHYMKQSKAESPLVGEARTAAKTFHAMRIAAESGEDVAKVGFATGFARMTGADAGFVQRLASIAPKPLGLDIPDVGEDVRNKAQLGLTGSNAATGTSETVGGKIKQGIPSPNSKEGQDKMRLEYNQRVNKVQKHGKNSETLTRLKGETDRNETVDRINENSLMVDKTGRAPNGLAKPIGRSTEGAAKASVLSPQAVKPNQNKTVLQRLGSFIELKD